TVFVLAVSSRAARSAAAFGGRRPLTKPPTRTTSVHAIKAAIRSAWRIGDPTLRAGSRRFNLPPLPDLKHHPAERSKVVAHFAGNSTMFSNINNDAIVSENYAKSALFYQAVFGMRTSDKTRVSRAQ